MVAERLLRPRGKGGRLHMHVNSSRWDPVPELGERLKELDRVHHSLVLATVNEAGDPHAAPVFFAWEFGRPAPSVAVTVLASSAKLGNLRRDRRAALTITGPLPRIWLNGHGRAEELDGADREAALASILEKSPSAEGFVGRLPTALVRIVLHDFRLTDITGPDGRPAVFTYPEPGGGADR